MRSSCPYAPRSPNAPSRSWCGSADLEHSSSAEAIDPRGRGDVLAQTEEPDAPVLSYRPERGTPRGGGTPSVGAGPDGGGPVVEGARAGIPQSREPDDGEPDASACGPKMARARSRMVPR